MLQLLCTIGDFFRLRIIRVVLFVCESSGVDFYNALDRTHGMHVTSQAPVVRLGKDPRLQPSAEKEGEKKKKQM